MKNLIIIIGSITVIGLGLILGFRSIVSSIYNKVDCQQFNIDNIEVRTGIDIPAVTDVQCECNADKTKKTSTFTLDSEKVDLQQFVARNKFQYKDGQYQHTGQRPDTHWQAVLDKETYQLTVVIEYF